MHEHVLALAVEGVVQLIKGDNVWIAKDRRYQSRGAKERELPVLVAIVCF